MHPTGRKLCAADHHDVSFAVERVLREVRGEFLAAETSSSQGALQGLACTRPTTPARDFGLTVPSEDRVQDVPVENGHCDTLTVFSFPEQGLPTEHTRTVRCVRQSTVDEVFEEHPPYESCQPASANIIHGDDSHSMPFMPYADDDSFSREAYTDEHQRFSWQPPGGTSLHDIWIAVEAARRLQEEYAVDFAAVDATGILPTNLLSTSDDWGAIVKSQNMDRPPFLAEKWGKDLSLIDVSPPAMDALSSRVQSGLSLFCGNMNCVSGYCSVHNGEKHLLDDDDRYLAYADYCIPTSAEPCGDACYLLANIMDTEQKNSKRKRNTMGSQDVENLKLLFKISPESTSCEISQLMQYRCYEVYSYRAEYHRATRAHKELSVERPVTYIQCVHQSASPKSTSGTAATQPSLSRHFEPCSHRGPCEPSAQECTCYRRNVHCERNCCCTLDCTRRFPGCECARLRQEANKQRSPDDSYEPEPDLCSDSDCPCAAAGRECDPELCDCLHDLYSEEAECRNVSLRRKRGKRVKAGTSFSGLGVFLEEPVGRGELVCEYVGELTYEATTETRDLLAQHRGRAYVYKLNDTFDVDASTVGNVARFINHAPSKRANCITKIMNVSGDHRIGIYSAKHLRSGTELTIDYGDEFFKSDAKASSSSSRTLTPAGFERSEGKSVQE